MRSGMNWEEQGDYTKALACYQTAEKLVNDYAMGRESVLRAAFIQFDNGNRTEALRLVNLLASAAQKGKAKTGEQVGDVIVLANGTPGPPTFWDNWQAWWPQWQQIETAAGLAPVKDHKVIPIIPSLVDLGKDLGTARNGKDTKGPSSRIDAANGVRCSLLSERGPGICRRLSRGRGSPARSRQRFPAAGHRHSRAATLHKSPRTNGNASSIFWSTMLIRTKTTRPSI